MDDGDERTGIEAQLHRRRDALARAWAEHDAVVLVAAGEPIGRPGRDDTTYRFETHAEYFYLTDRERPGGVLAFDPDAGWVDFVAPVTVDERLWSGASDSPPDAPSMGDLADWLAARERRRRAWLGSAPPDAGADPELSAQLRFDLADVRRIKDSVELERMRVAQRATQAAFVVAATMMREGVSEREVQIEFEAEAFRHGAETMAYDTIVGGGPNSAVLHFPPSTRRFATGELVLIDAGGQFRGYASDITRTYPVGGELTDLQRELHATVHEALRTATHACRSGVEWRDIHRAAGLVIAEGLAGCGILRGEPADLVDSGAVWLFFPHGIGHLLGLGVRDAGGTPLRARRDQPKPFPNLRIDLPLKPGMVVTVEPGIYFVSALLQDDEQRRRHRHAVAWEQVDALRDFGGIRIEDNVLITADGHEVLTAGVPVLGL